MNRNVLYESDFARVIAVGEPSGKTACVTFYTLVEDESKLRGAAGFGEAMLKENGIPAIHFINLQNHWWQIPDLASAIDIANKWLASSTSRVGYGASMGGYAALNFSERLRLDKVLSFSPQYSIDKKKVPWETRWQNEADKLTFTDDDLVVAENCTTHIIYDPNIRDGKHVDLISLTGKTILHRVEGAGHKAIAAFSKADLLKPLVLSVLQGDLDVSIIQRLKNTGKETLRGHMMINIEERGATRGTADIGPVLQRCIDEAAEVVAMQQKQGKWMTVKSAVLIPAGRWRLETPIKLRTGVSIYGEDQASTLLECAIPSGQFAFSTADEKEPYSLKIKNLHAFSLQRFTGGFLSTRMANRSCIMEQLFVE